MKQNPELFLYSGLMAFCMILPPMLGGCSDSMTYPTVATVKTLAEAENEHRTGLQEATVNTMTDQHTAMAPELEEVLATILTQNRELSASLHILANEAAAKAEGASIGGLGDALGGGLIPSLMSMFGLGSLIPIDNMFFGKSRAQKELDEMKLAMAVRAGEKDTGL